MLAVWYVGCKSGPLKSFLFLFFFDIMPSTFYIPHNFSPRFYQHKLFHAMDSGFKRAMCLWHRRTGKDLCMVNWMCKKMLERVGVYYYYFPTATLGRKILWNGIDGLGNKFIDYLPEELRTKHGTKDREMSIEFRNGSFFQIIGTDRLDVVGTNPVGCIFSEYSKQNPLGWDYVRPILAENNGWAILNTTPRGKNHCFDLWEKVKNNPGWYTDLLTADDSGAISASAIEDERESGMSEEMIQQEFYCSFEGGLEGAVFGNEMNKLRSDARLGDYFYDDSYRVHTFWDLGVNDNIAVWFFQLVRDDYFKAIDYYEVSGLGLKGAVEDIFNKKRYVFGSHFAPWDIVKREQFSGRSTLEQARDWGISFERVPKTRSLSDDLELCRNYLGRVVINKETCGHGVECLENYYYETVEKKSKQGYTFFNKEPVHDWSSHGCSAFRTFVKAFDLGMVHSGKFGKHKRKRQKRASSEENLFG